MVCERVNPFKVAKLMIQWQVFCDIGDVPSGFITTEIVFKFIEFLSDFVVDLS